jgi:hypothetical protein
VTELDLVCGEGWRVPGWQWLAWDTAERDAVRAELRVNLAARVDERSGVVTLVAEVRVG